GRQVLVGQVYKVASTTGSTQFYVMLQDGLASISQTQATLLTFERGAQSAVTLNSSLISGHTSRSTPTMAGGAPPPPPPPPPPPGAAAPPCGAHPRAGGPPTRHGVAGGRRPAGRAPPPRPGPRRCG